MHERFTVDRLVRYKIEDIYLQYMYIYVYIILHKNSLPLIALSDTNLVVLYLHVA